MVAALLRAGLIASGAQAQTAPSERLESFGLMVNYLYDAEAIENNIEAFLGEGRIAMSAAVRRLTRP